MKQIIVLAIVTLSLNSIHAQDIYLTRTGKIEFHAGTSVEDVDAVNNEVTSLVNVKTGDIAFNILIKSFHFKRALMEEHFNENYLESSKIPKATFKGKINDLSTVNFAKDGTYKTMVSGELNLHGVSQNVTMPATVTIGGGKIHGQASFQIKPEDYKIAIPSLVQDKIAKVVNVIVDCDYEPKK
jgi:polyisoprenoid-binding protein YceI